MTAKVVPPGGYLMGIETAAKELGLEVADLLAYAEDRGANTALRVCVMVPDECVVFPISEPQPEPAGLELEDRCFAFVDGLNLEGVPRFFRELRVRGRATLRDCLPMVMVDLSGWVSADGMEVRLTELMVPRKDIEALKKDRSSTVEQVPEPTSVEQVAASSTGSDSASGPTRMRNRKAVDRAKALLDKDPERFARGNGDPIWQTLANALIAEGRAGMEELSPKHVSDILRKNWS